MNPSLGDLQSALVRLAPPTPTVEPASVTGGAVPEAAPAPPDGVPAAPPAPCQLTDAKTRGCHLDARVAPDRIVAAAELLDRSGFVIDTVTGVDWMSAGEMELVYDFFHLTAPLHVVVRTRVPRDNPELPTISEVFPGANWHERETHEFFGIRFLGHPNLSPLLLPEDATYHPLRKDFAGAA
jgi:NADH-quinone oxidoreductase subunit C